MGNKLYTMNIHSDLHHASTTINRWGWADYLFSIHDNGNFITAVFRMPAQKVHDIRADNGFQDPEFDTYRGPPDPYLDFPTHLTLADVQRAQHGYANEDVSQEAKDVEAQHVFDAEQEKRAEIEQVAEPEPSEIPVPAPDPEPTPPTLESPMPPLPVIPEAAAKPKKPAKVKLEKPKDEAPATAPAEEADLSGLPEWAR